MSYKIIRASEIGEYIFCRRAWWLRRVGGVRPDNIEELAAGTHYHQQHGRLVFQANRNRQLAYLLIFLAFTILAFLVVRGL